MSCDLSDSGATVHPRRRRSTRRPEHSHSVERLRKDAAMDDVQSRSDTDVSGSLPDNAPGGRAVSPLLTRTLSRNRRRASSLRERAPSTLSYQQAATSGENNNDQLASECAVDDTESLDGQMPDASPKPSSRMSKTDRLRLVTKLSKEEIIKDQSKRIPKLENELSEKKAMEQSLVKVVAEKDANITELKNQLRQEKDQQIEDMKNGSTNDAVEEWKEKYIALKGKLTEAESEREPLSKLLTGVQSTITELEAKIARRKRRRDTLTRDDSPSSPPKDSPEAPAAVAAGQQEQDLALVKQEQSISLSPLRRQPGPIDSDCESVVSQRPRRSSRSPGKKSRALSLRSQQTHIHQQPKVHVEDMVWNWSVQSQINSARQYMASVEGPFVYDERKERRRRRSGEEAMLIQIAHNTSLTQWRTTPPAAPVGYYICS